MMLAMTRPPRTGAPLQAPSPPSTDKVHLLFRLLGLEGTELDLFIQLCTGPGDEVDCAGVDDGPPGGLSAPGMQPVADAYPEETVEALLAQRPLRLPRGLSRSVVAAMAVRLRLLLLVRDRLAGLMERCERSARPLAEALDRLALWAAPQVRVRRALTPEPTDQPDPLAPLLAYYDRRCQEGGALFVRAAGDAVIGRQSATDRPLRPSAVPPARPR